MSRARSLSCARALLATGLATTLTSSALHAQPAEEPAKVVVRSAKRQPNGASASLTGAAARTLAGTQGDALKAVQSLPGVARADTGGGQLLLWGSTGDESTLLVDGVPVPFAFHGSALRSVVPSALVRSLRVWPGAYPLRYGRRLGGVLHAELAAPSLNGPQLELALDGLDAAAAASTPLHRDVAVRLAARTGLVDRWLPTFIPETSRPLYAVPAYWDAQGQLLAELDEHTTLRLALLAASDTLADGVATVARAAFGGERAFERASLVVERRGDDGSRSEVRGWLGADRRTLTGTESLLATNAWLAGLRAEQTQALGVHTLTTGLDVELEATKLERAGSLTVPPREGDRVLLGQLPSADRLSERQRLVRAAVAPYVELDAVVGPVRALVGVRLETFATDVEESERRPLDVPAEGSFEQHAALAPRLEVSSRVHPSLELFGVVSRHAQPPAAADLGAQSGNPKLAPATATHVALGPRLSIAGASVELTGFAKRLHGLAARAPTGAVALAATGDGEVLGAQLHARLERPERYQLAIAVTLSRSERRNAETLPLLPSSSDQPVVATLVAQRYFGPWGLSARARFSSGSPRPLVVGSFVELGSERAQPLLAADRLDRLPPRCTIDLRAEWKYAVGRTLVIPYLEAVALPLLSGAEEWLYSWDYRERLPLTGMAPLALLGLRVELR